MRSGERVTLTTSIQAWIRFYNPCPVDYGLRINELYLEAQVQDSYADI